MGKSGRSVLVFGLCLIVLDLILLVVPNFVLKMFLFPGTAEVWIGVAGKLLLILGYYYAQSSRKVMNEFSDRLSMFAPIPSSFLLHLCF
jgi:hypothetical protein